MVRNMAKSSRAIWLGPSSPKGKGSGREGSGRVGRGGEGEWEGGEGERWVGEREREWWVRRGREGGGRGRIEIGWRGGKERW